MEPQRVSRRPVRLAAMLALLLAAGCAVPPAGRDFARPGQGALGLTQSTPAQAIAAIGPPQEDRQLEAATLLARGESAFPFGHALAGRGAGAIRELVYRHVGRGNEAARPELEPTRELRLWFIGGRLVGYLGSSSFRRDSTAFDARRVGALRPHASSLIEAQRALGPASGAAVHPLVAREGNEMLTWLSDEYDRFRDERRRTRLDLLVDPRGIVRDLKFSSSMRPAPPPVPTVIDAPPRVPTPLVR